MSDLRVFANKDFGEIRTTIIDGAPWFVASDVCIALDISNSRDAVSRIDADEKGVVLTDTLGGIQEVTTVNESGLYSLVLGSRKPEAKAFKRWITHDVLPAINKHGMYATPATVEAMLEDPDTMIRTLQALKEERAKRVEAEKKIEQDKPKVLFAETCLGSQESILIRELAKIIGDIGEHRLYSALRNQGLLMSNNEPYQEYIDRGYFEVIQRPITTAGGVILKRTTKVLPKGQEYIIKKLAVS